MTPAPVPAPAEEPYNVLRFDILVPLTMAVEAQHQEDVARGDGTLKGTSHLFEEAEAKILARLREALEGMAADIKGGGNDTWRNADVDTALAVALKKAGV